MQVAAVSLEIDDRIADELPGPVERDVAATLDLEQLDPPRREQLGRREEVPLLRRAAERDHRRMLDEQQHVLLDRRRRCARARPRADTRAPRRMERGRGARPTARRGLFAPIRPARATASGHAWIILPSESRHASATASDSVGMRMDREVHFLDRELVRPRDDELVNQLRRVRADDVRAEDLAVLRVANDLHEALRLARRARAAAGHERKLPDLVVELLVLALLLGEADRRDFGMAVRRVRDVAVVHSVRALAGEQLGQDDAFALALVREHRRAGDVADGVDALGGRLHAAR